MWQLSEKTCPDCVRATVQGQHVSFSVAAINNFFALLPNDDEHATFVVATNAEIYNKSQVLGKDDEKIPAKTSAKTQGTCNRCYNTRGHQCCCFQHVGSVSLHSPKRLLILTAAAPQERKDDAPPAKPTTATSKKKDKERLRASRHHRLLLMISLMLPPPLDQLRRSDGDNDVATSARSVSPLSPSPSHATASAPTSVPAKTRTKRIVGRVIKPRFIDQMPTDIMEKLGDISVSLEFDDSLEPTDAPTSPTPLATKHLAPTPTPMTSFKKDARKPSPYHT
ncbi:hypothetical protein V6N13_139907 [Hibiscus sabdariffa]